MATFKNSTAVNNQQQHAFYFYSCAMSSLIPILTHAQITYLPYMVRSSLDTIRFHVLFCKSLYVLTPSMLRYPVQAIISCSSTSL